MGTSGMVGPIGVITGWAKMPEGYAVGAVGLDRSFASLHHPSDRHELGDRKFMRAKGWIKEGDLKIDLG